MKKIAILYQAKPAPLKDGIQKPMKVGGYSDSGADIAFALLNVNFPVLTPQSKPQIKNDFDWVFPDTKAGIQLAYDMGARIFWLNTVLYKVHAIEDFFEKDIEIVGQDPSTVDVYDNKLFTNNLLRKNGLPIPKSILISKNNIPIPKVNFPVVIKPIRGRGSQGISIAHHQAALNNKLTTFFKNDKYGTSCYLEEFLIGQEITITVMPPGKYFFKNELIIKKNHWSLHTIKRFNHKNGIAPYSGLVAVMNNSILLNEQESHMPAIKIIARQCEDAANIINSKAPIRIDCRANEKGEYFIFDLNLKPNMTGYSRPHRKNQDSLSVIAAKKIGWSYTDLLVNILNQKWKAYK